MEVQPIGVKFCMMVDMGSRQVFSLSKLYISKTVSRSITCRLGRNISMARTLKKCIAWDGSLSRESPIKKICIFCSGQISWADRRENLYDGRALSWMRDVVGVYFWWGYLWGFPSPSEGQKCFWTICLRHNVVSLCHKQDPLINAWHGQASVDLACIAFTFDADVA